MEKIWNNLALLPPKVVDAIRAYTIELEEVQGHIRRSTPTSEQLNSDVGYLMDRDRVVTGYPMPPPVGMGNVSSGPPVGQPTGGRGVPGGLGRGR